MFPTSNPSPLGEGRNWPLLRRRRAVGERLPIWEAEAGKVLAFLVWGGFALSWTHWTGARTIGCAGRLHGCPWCAGQRPRLRGYLGAYALQDGPRRYQRIGRCVVCLTHAALRDLVELRRPVGELLGRRLQISRAGDLAIGQVLAQLGPDVGAERPSERTVNPRTVLVRVWTEGEDRLSAGQVEQMLDLAAKTPIWEE